MSTISKEFTKEQLIEKLQHRISVASGFPESEKAQMDLELARIALASLEAKPVSVNDDMAYAFHHAISDSSLGSDEVEEIKAGLRAAFANVTAQPAPASVPDDVSGPLAYAYKELTPTFMRNHIDVFERYGIYPDGSAGIQAMRIALDGMNRRAAMLQGAEQQNRQQNIPENIPATQFKPVADLYGLTSPTGSETSFTFDAVEARDFIDGGWSCQEYVELGRFQEAVSGNSPVIPDGWVAVPVEPTEHMIVEGFESEPDEFFSDAELWEVYNAMTGCQQAAHRAKLCWAAMIAASQKS
ncbi:hypothetical protein QRZ33_17200 [Enterobacter hormaechei]|uniref:hypothetical protein n=1 Tax=Enterobacter hormaechei TaxID=158836 RepID=UPI00255B0F7D|nr:hypothetical protein [Enterobacter hormaechei]MDL4477228.1 hypothetical protein [Enterobacter hormaechei]MDL4480591.1 hypothetical protein [Enterobacter hormaechei]MDL4495417.1 hypothetical protein [Enterobacter hormaechei]MDL4542116.1 hypothetical protein [Enterobacter hormaechei]MDL4718930.1 hypothetical protein [Enterobacter hormaechei]